MEEKRCEICGKKFIPSIHNQKWCGSRTKKIGCSWKQRQWRDNHRYLDPKHKIYQRKYGKEWKKQQRKENTDYAKRQRKVRRNYYNTEHGRKKQRDWRKRNIKKILCYNRKRLLKKKKVKGSHTNTQWENKKKEHNYRCTICKDTEKQIKEKWKHTTSPKLTKDHIIPINKGGMDYIENIQPLCISCNAKKKDEIKK